MKKVILILLLGFFSLVSKVGAQQVTQEQCQQADAQLNQVYKQLMGTLNDAQKQQLKTAQRQWIKKRDASIAANPGNPKGVLYQATMDRVKNLEAYYKKIQSAKLQTDYNAIYNKDAPHSLSDAEASALFEKASKIYMSGDIRSAIPLFEKALNLYEKHVGAENSRTEDILQALGDCYIQNGNSLEAIPLLERAVLIHEEKIGSTAPVSEAYELILLGNAYEDIAHKEKSKYNNSINCYKRSLLIYENEKTPKEDCIIEVLVALGRVYNSIAEYTKALEELERALKLSENIDETKIRWNDVCDVLELIGKTYWGMGDYIKSNEYTVKALEISLKKVGKDSIETSTILRNQGFNYITMGNYNEAKNALEKSLVISQKNSGFGGSATLEVLGILYREIGDFEKSLYYLERALEIDEKKYGSQHQNVAYDLGNIGILYNSVGEYNKALPLLNRALSIYEKSLGTNSPSFAAQLNNMSDSYNGLGNYSEAIVLSEKSLLINERVLGTEHPYTAMILGDLGEMYTVTGDFAKAAKSLERAFAINEKLFESNNPTLTLNLKDLGIQSYLSGDLLKAQSFASRFINSQADSLQTILCFGEAQRLAWASHNLAYDLPAASLGSEKNVQLILTWKGIVLDSIMEDRAIQKIANATEDGKLALDKIQSLKYQIARIAISRSLIGKDQIHHLRDQIDNLETSMAQNLHIGGRVRMSSQVSLDQIQANLSVGDVILDFICFNDLKTKSKCYGVSIINKNGVPEFIRIDGATEINGAIESSLKAISSGDEAAMKKQYAILLGKLWKPLAEALPSSTKKLYIGADGPLNFLSFATLLDEKGNFLGEDYNIAYAGTGRDLLRKHSSSSNKTLVLYANPEFSKDELSAGSSNAMAMRAVDLREISKVQLPALPGTKEEAKAISSVAKLSQWKIDEHFGGDATKASIMQLKSPLILHLATHGFFLGGSNHGGDGERGMKLAPVHLTVTGDSMNALSTFNEISPMRQSGVALAGGQSTLQAWGRGEFPDPSNDGILTAEEVAGLNLDGTWLVTLSACETGVGQVQSGEGVFGLRRAFMMAGAQNLLMTLWPVSDEVTPKIMADFYREAFKTGDAAGSLAKVQRDWLIKLRKERGLLAAVRDAGPFAMVVMANPHASASSQ